MIRDRHTPPHAKNLRIGRYSEPGRPYHITKCVAPTIDFPLAQSRLAEIVIASIHWHQVEKHTHLLAFVVMPDHVHWLFVLGERRTLDEVMEGVGGLTSRQINSAVGRRGVFWQEGYHDHAVRRDHEEARAVIEYIHNNPVRRGLCLSPEEWPWSTANESHRGWMELDWFW